MQIMPADEVIRLTKPGLMVPRLAADHYESIILELAGRLQQQHHIDATSVFVDSVMAHDEFASAILDDVAFPLGRSSTVRELSFAVGITKQPIHWLSPRSQLVQMVILIAVPPQDEDRYLSLVPAFSSLFKNKTIVPALRKVAESEAMFNLFCQALSKHEK